MAKIQIKLFGSGRNPYRLSDGTVISWRGVLENQVNEWLDKNKKACIYDMQYKVYSDGVELLIQYAEDEE